MSLLGLVDARRLAEEMLDEARASLRPFGARALRLGSSRTTSCIAPSDRA